MSKILCPVCKGRGEIPFPEDAVDMSDYCGELDCPQCGGMGYKITTLAKSCGSSRRTKIEDDQK